MRTRQLVNSTFFQSAEDKDKFILFSTRSCFAFMRNLAGVSDKAESVSASAVRRGRL